MTRWRDRVKRGNGNVLEPEEGSFSLSEVISALSYALDLTEGQPMGHAVKSCALGMKISEQLGLFAHQRADLYYALLLKDAGCSSNASRMYSIVGDDEREVKHDIKLQDWTTLSVQSLGYMRKHLLPGRPARERLFAALDGAANRDSQSLDMIKTRCERGADIAQKMGFSSEVSKGIFSLDEMWNGNGYPERRRKHEIPLLSQIMSLAQTLDVYNSMHGPGPAIEIALARSRRWFNPELVEVVESWGSHDPIWEALDTDVARERVHRLAPAVDHVEADEQRINDICEAFAAVIDAKSPYTYRHSLGVADAAGGIARSLELPRKECTWLRRAALLHDIGKLSVSNAILEKSDKLDDDEWAVIRRHPLYTLKILEKAPVFRDLAFVAAAHHERLDGSGYHLAMSAEDLPLEARILAVADIFDALAADRPYRAGMPLEQVLGIIGGDVPHALDEECFTALRSWIDEKGWNPSLNALGRTGKPGALASPPESLDPAVMESRIF